MEAWTRFRTHTAANNRIKSLENLWAIDRIFNGPKVQLLMDRGKGVGGTYCKYKPEKRIFDPSNVNAMADGLVIIPTFNEIENIGAMVQVVFELKKDFHLLVVDDN